MSIDKSREKGRKEEKTVRMRKEGRKEERQEGWKKGNG